MAVLNSSDRLTAVEAVKRSGFSPDARRVIEELSVTNEILLDAPVVEANEGTVHTHLVRTAIPKATHRAYNEGVGSSSSKTKTVKDVISQIAIYSKIDEDLINQHPHPKEFMMSESVAFIEGMSQQQAQDFIYGDHSKDPRYMNGFATRRSKIDNVTTIDMKGTGDNLTSIYLVKWGNRFCSVIYPRGSNSVGITVKDKGTQTVKADNGGEYEARVTYFKSDFGLAVGHEKSFIRLANIDLSKTTGEEIVKAILKHKAKLPAGDGTVSILCNQDIMGLIDVATMDKNNVCYTSEDPWGREVNKLRDMRFRRVDAILNTESQVV